MLLLANYTNESKFKTQSSESSSMHKVNNKPRFKRDRKKEKKAQNVPAKASVVIFSVVVSIIINVVCVISDEFDEKSELYEFKISDFLIKTHTHVSLSVYDDNKIEVD